MIERTLAPGVTLRLLGTSKFKTSMLAVTFLEPLREETAALNALLPKVLRRGTQKHPDLESISAGLDELYGMNLEPIVRKKGEVQCLGFWASVLDDAFVPGQSNILEEAASLLGEMVLHPAGAGEAFLPEYVDSEKANLIDKIRGEINDKLQYALSRLRSQMCQGEAYGVNRYGSEESAQAITGEALYQRYRTLLETAPVYLYYCGSAEPERVERAFRAAFADLPQTPRQPMPQTQALAKPQGALRRFSDRHPGQVDFGLPPGRWRAELGGHRPGDGPPRPLRRQYQLETLPQRAGTAVPVLFRLSVPGPEQGHHDGVLRCKV